MSDRKKCLIFGGTGFIGKHLVDDLIRDGHDVTVFTRSHPGQQHENEPGINYHYGDFFNPQDIEGAVEGQEYVFHLISLTNPAISDADPYIDLDTNVKMTIHLLEACSRHDVKKVIFTSSGGSIYGDTAKDSLSERDPTAPISPYAIGKQTIEGYLRYFQRKHNLDYCVYRISNVYGEGQNTVNNKHGVISVFLDKIASDSELTVYGDGSMTRDYIYVKDLTNYISRISFGTMKHRLYNIGSGTGDSVIDILHAIEKITDKKARISYAKTPSSYVNKIVLDCKRAEDEFGRISNTSLEEGISIMHKTRTYRQSQS
jgi:UDP-glucose 4-epimerase